ncbi:p55 [Cucumis melo var. makuwa]|uniref:p55 n=2 Tax=Cucumis melo TaxID=3656 RepID=A0A5D3BJN2_CUCMM|nr:p55 [Cucumis melo var. makuwa]TYJ99337.1 p55 [Cucumis melo var. makuwa]
MGGEFNHVIHHAIFNPPLSPGRKNAPKVTESSSVEPHTPDAVLGKKRPASVSPNDVSEHDHPPTQKPKTDNAEKASSSGVPMKDLIGKVEDMLKMLKRVVRKNDKLVSDPLLACFVSAQTLLMACTAELLSKSTGKKKPPLVHQHSDSSINYGSTTTADPDAAAPGGSGERKFKKYKSSAK